MQASSLGWYLHGQPAPLLKKKFYIFTDGSHTHTHARTHTHTRRAYNYTILLYIYIYTYGSRSKGPCKEFCESRACYVGNPRDSFFSSSRKFFIFAKASRKLDIRNHYHCIHYSLLRATTSCRLGSGRRMVPHHRSSQAFEGEPNNMVLKHILAPAAGTA